MPTDRPRPVVDFGAHFYPSVLEPRREEHDAIEAYAGSPVLTDIEAVRERYSAAGVDRAVLSQPFYMGSSDEEAVARANDELIEVVERYDDLYALSALPVAAGGEAAAYEFERTLDAGYNGAAVETRSDSIELIDPEMEAVLETADRTSAPLLVHPKLNDSLGPGTLDDHWQLNSIFGREAALAESISKVIHEGIYDRYPNLTLVFHHLGGNIAAALGRIEGAITRAKRDGNAHLKSYDEFARLLGSRVYLDTSGVYGDVETLRRCLEFVPATNVLFATDFPYETVHPEDFQKIVGAIERVRTGTERDAILGENALDVMVNVD